jgi:hypothetical protein
MLKSCAKRASKRYLWAEQDVIDAVVYVQTFSTNSVDNGYAKSELGATATSKGVNCETLRI